MSPDSLGRGDSWEDVRACVVGLGPAGFAAADNLTHLGASVTVLAESAAGERAEKATLLEILGARVLLGSSAVSVLPAELDLLVTTPEVPLSSSLPSTALSQGVPVWSETELAWRLRDTGAPPWLAVTGRRGGVRAARLLEAMLRAEGLRPVLAGEAGLPLVEAVMDPTAYDVLVAALAPEQLRFTSSLACESAAVLEVGEPPEGWPPEEYAAALGRVFEGNAKACVYNDGEEATADLVREAEVVEGARAIGVTVGIPSVGMVGLVEDVLADRAFVEQRHSHAAELGTIADLGSDDPPLVVDALTAAALARAHGVSSASVRHGLRASRP